ncbi:MAG: hypothetical protein ACYTGQ_19460, partial [Planctomycetota bacterium]
MIVTPLLMVALVGAALVLVVGRASDALEAAGWLALAIVGEAAALQLIDAGPRVHYQHYRSTTEIIARGDVLPLALVGTQTVLVSVGFARRRVLASVRTWSQSARFRAWQWAALFTVLIMTSATLSRDPLFYIGETALAATIQVVNLVTIALFAVAIPASALGRMRERRDRWFGGEVATDGPALDRFALLGAFWVTLVAAMLSIFVYERHPHIPDEVSYLFQARYFAAGMLSMPAPPVIPAFDVDLMAFEPHRWFSPVPPGWSAMLAVGVLFGAPWLVNPLLAGLNVLLTSALITREYDRRTSRLVVLLLCCSPWHVFMAMNFMNHTFAFTCLLVGALAVQKMRSNGGSWWGVPAG